MRAILFFLLLPAWVAAQPVEVTPEQVVGFARSLKEDGIDQRFLLVLDGEGRVEISPSPFLNPTPAASFAPCEG